MNNNHYSTKQIIGTRKDKKTGVPVSDPHRLKKLEEENNRLKKLVADLALDVKLLREIALSYW